MKPIWQNLDYLDPEFSASLWCLPVAARSAAVVLGLAPPESWSVSRAVHRMWRAKYSVLVTNSKLSIVLWLQQKLGSRMACVVVWGLVRMTFIAVAERSCCNSFFTGEHACSAVFKC